jgi:hypothetical protein
MLIQCNVNPRRRCREGDQRRARLEVWVVAELAMRFAGRLLAIDAAIAEHAGKDERGRSSAIDGP